MTPTQASIDALNNLRVLNSELGWYVIPLLALVLYIYGVEIKKARETGNWSTVFAGLTILGLDLINEIWNGTFLPLPTTPLFGLHLEQALISF